MTRTAKFVVAPLPALLMLWVVKSLQVAKPLWAMTQDEGAAFDVTAMLANNADFVDWHLKNTSSSAMRPIIY